MLVFVFFSLPNHSSEVLSQGPSCLPMAQKFQCGLVLVMFVFQPSIFWVARLAGNEGMEPYMVMMGIHSLIPYKGPASFESVNIFEP